MFGQLLTKDSKGTFLPKMALKGPGSGAALLASVLNLGVVPLLLLIALPPSLLSGFCQKGEGGHSVKRLGGAKGGSEMLGGSGLDSPRPWLDSGLLTLLSNHCSLPWSRPPSCSSTQAPRCVRWSLDNTPPTAPDPLPRSGCVLATCRSPGTSCSGALRAVPKADLA